MEIVCRNYFIILHMTGYDNVNPHCMKWFFEGTGLHGFVWIYENDNLSRQNVQEMEDFTKANNKRLKNHVFIR